MLSDWAIKHDSCEVTVTLIFNLSLIHRSPEHWVCNGQTIPEPNASSHSYPVQRAVKKTSALDGIKNVFCSSHLKELNILFMVHLSSKSLHLFSSTGKRLPQTLPSAQDLTHLYGTTEMTPQVCRSWVTTFTSIWESWQPFSGSLDKSKCGKGWKTEM